jgi:hypothetical protein
MWRTTRLILHNDQLLPSDWIGSSWRFRQPQAPALCHEFVWNFVARGDNAPIRARNCGPRRTLNNVENVQCPPPLPLPRHWLHSNLPSITVRSNHSHECLPNSLHRSHQLESFYLGSSHNLLRSNRQCNHLLKEPPELLEVVPS